jgi:hypothetical protein
MSDMSVEEWINRRMEVAQVVGASQFQRKKGNGILTLGETTPRYCINPLAALRTIRIPRHPLIPSTIARLLYLLGRYLSV